MKPISFKVILGLGFFLFASCVSAQSGADALVGRYEFSSGTLPRDVFLSVTISREAGELTFGLMAGHPDAHGAAPDGGGTGIIGPDGAFRFSYEDSFSNKGTGTFKRIARGYALSIHIDDVRDSRCMPFYGEFILQRVSK